MISYYSTNKDKFDIIRNSPTLFDRATAGIKALSVVKGEYQEKINVFLQTVITRFNYDELPNLLSLAIKYGFDSLSLSVLEHAYQNPDLYLTPVDYAKLKTEILPHMIEIIEESQLSENIKNMGIKSIERAFLENESADFCKGIYRSKQHGLCPNKHNYIVIGPRGDTLPCCGLEYYNDAPLFSNVYNTRIENIVNGHEFRNFWETPNEICQYCGVSRHFYISLS